MIGGGGFLVLGYSLSYSLLLSVALENRIL
jgi:hypothetical protein